MKRYVGKIFANPHTVAEGYEIICFNRALLVDWLIEDDWLIEY